MKNSDVFTFFEPASKSIKNSYVSDINLISAVWVNEATDCSSKFPEDVAMLKLALRSTCPKNYKSAHENCENVLKKKWANILNGFFGLNLFGFNFYLFFPVLISLGEVRTGEMP